MPIRLVNWPIETLPYRTWNYFWASKSVDWRNRVSINDLWVGKKCICSVRPEKNINTYVLQIIQRKYFSRVILAREDLFFNPEYLYFEAETWKLFVKPFLYLYVHSSLSVTPFLNYIMCYIDSWKQARKKVYIQITSSLNSIQYWHQESYPLLACMCSRVISYD